MLGKNTFRMETYSTQNIGSSSGFPTDVFYIFTIVLGISAYIVYHCHYAGNSR